MSVLRSSLLFFCLLLLPVAAWSLPAGTKAPGFEVRTSQGETLSLEQYRGEKSVLLIFWTTWCPYCKQEFKHMDEFLTDYEEQSLAVIGINSGWRDTVSKMQRFQKRYQVDIPLAFDHEHRVSQDYNIRGVPTILLIDREGTVVFSGHRFSDRLSDILTRVTTTNSNE